MSALETVDLVVSALLGFGAIAVIGCAAVIVAAARA